MVPVRTFLALVVVSLLVVPNLAVATPGPDVPGADAHADLGLVDDLLPVVDEDETARFVVGHGEAVPELLDRLVHLLGGRIVRTDDVLAFSVIEVPASATDRLRSEAAYIDGLRYVREDGRMAALFTPDDPRYVEQWGPAAIGMEAAWDVGRGDHSVEVAVIDTGVDHTHPDLATNVCRNGPDYVNDDDDPMDDHYHGTHVAGTVAGVIDNGVGVAGMANACVVPVKVLDAGGSGHWSDLASALVWTADNGIEIASMSLGGCCDPGEPLTSAVDYAAQKGVLLIAAAGNAYCSPVGYPAAYPAMVAVGSLDEPGNVRSSFSSCGPEVEVSAPGRDIMSTVPESVHASGYGTLSGTSMATPHVSGVAALFWSQHPDATADAVRCVLAQQATDLDLNGHDEGTGYGRIDAAAMLLDPTCAVQVPEAPALQGRPGDLAAALSWEKPFAWGGVDGYIVERSTNGSAWVEVANVSTHDHVETGLSEGETYAFRVLAYNAAGRGAPSDPVTIVAHAALSLPHTLDFDDGFGAWTATGLWHVSPDRADDETDRNAYFGEENGPGLEDNSYDTGWTESGAIESPALRLPAGNVSMRFWQHFEVEFGWEHPIVQIANETDPFTYTTVWSMGGYEPFTGQAAVDLSAHAGEVVYLRFFIDTLDPIANVYEGWYLDDVEIVAEAAPSYAPVPAIVLPNDSRIWPSNHVVAGPYTDANGDQDVVDITYAIDGAPADSARLFGQYFREEYSGLATGTHAVTVTASDASGLTGTAQSEFEVDGDPPELTVASPVVGSIMGCQFQVDGDAYDGYSGISYVYAVVTAGGYESQHFGGVQNATFSLPVDVTMLDPGPFNLTVVAHDSAGNSNTTLIALERDRQDCRPQVELYEPTEGQVFDCSLPISGRVTSPTGRELWWVSAYLDGSHLTSHYLPDGQNFSLEAAIGALAPGPHVLRVEAYDERHAWNDTVVTFERSDVDCMPQVTIDASLEGAVADCRLTITGQAEDPQGDDDLRIVLSAGGRYLGTAYTNPLGAWQVDAATGPLPAGEHALYAEVRDPEGNRNMSAPVGIVRTDLDCAPAVVVHAPTPETTAGCFVDVSAELRSRSGSELEWMVMRVDDHYVGSSWLSGATAWWNGTVFTDAGAGERTLELRVYDRDGNVNITQTTFQGTDTDCGTTLTLTTPTDGATVFDEVHIEGLVSGPEGMSVRVEAFAAGEYLGFVDLAAGEVFSFQWDSWSVSNGTHVIEVYAYSDHTFDHASVAVEVANEFEPYVDTYTYEGYVGCAVGWSYIEMKDRCDDRDQTEVPIEPHMDAFRIELEWEADLPQGIDTLSVTLFLDDMVYRASGEYGDGRLVIEQLFETSQTFIQDEAKLEVRASSKADGPAVALDVEFTLTSTWAYEGATLP